VSDHGRRFYLSGKIKAVLLDARGVVAARDFLQPLSLHLWSYIVPVASVIDEIAPRYLSFDMLGE